MSDSMSDAIDIYGDGLKVEVAPVVAAPGEVADSKAAAAHFEAVYHEAQSDDSQIPWHRSGSCPALISWLNAEAPSLIRPGGRVAVVGCGLGDDVAELEDRGYDVVGFDVSQTAIRWAKQRHPALAKHFVQADLFDLPMNLRRRFDLVIEVHTIQALHPTLRVRAAEAISALAGPHGIALLIARGRDEGQSLADFDAPPFPLTVSEFCGVMEANGMFATRQVDDYEDDGPPVVRRLRAAFRRP